MIYKVFGNLAAMPLSDPTWGDTAHQFNNQTGVARYFTEVMGQSTIDMLVLKSVIAGVTQSTDVSMPESMATLIGVAPAGVH